MRNENGRIMLTRRDALAASSICFAMSSRIAGATAPEPGGLPGRAVYVKDSDAVGMTEIEGIHDGKGKGRIKAFRFDGATAPANFIVYDLPPGASEGIHVHYLDNRNAEGSFDEFYYIVSGEGQMEIDGEIVPVVQGDHVYTPLEVSHGIENTHPSEKLRVFLTFIKRGNEPAPMRRQTG